MDMGDRVGLAATAALAPLCIWRARLGSLPLRSRNPSPPPSCRLASIPLHTHKNATTHVLS